MTRALAVNGSESVVFVDNGLVPPPCEPDLDAALKALANAALREVT
jgi:hypothetical protein